MCFAVKMAIRFLITQTASAYILILFSIFDWINEMRTLIPRIALTLETTCLSGGKNIEVRTPRRSFLLE